MDSPIDFVKGQNWEFKVDGGQIVVKTCPICHADDWKFYMNAKTGMWDCKHMNKHGALGAKSAGNMHSMRRILGLTHEVSAAANEKFHPLGFSEVNMVDNAHSRLLGKPHMLADLMSEWDISEETIKHFKLGVKQREDGRWWLLIPHFVDIFDGQGPQLYNIKFRTWFGEAKEFNRVKGASSVLFNESLLHQKDFKDAVLAEGEKDAIVSWDHGIKNVIGMTGGAGTLVARWYDLMEHLEQITIAYDGDLAGEEGTQKLISRLGSHRCKIAALPPGKDLADICHEQGGSAMRKIVNEAQQPSIPSISSAGDVLLDMITTTPPPVLPTFSKNFNKILGGGIRAPQLITVTAPPKIGKTTFSLALAHHYAMMGIPSLNYCIEMGMQDIASMVAGMHFGSGRDVGPIEQWLFKHDTDIPLYLGFQSSIEPDVLVQTFKDAYMRFGIGFIVFDNIHYLVRNLSDTSSKVQAMENAYKAFKMLTIELNIPMVVIAQPKKINVSKGADMNYYDVAWTGSAASDSDTIVIVHRDRSDESDRSFSDKMLIKADAGRFTQGGRTYVQYMEKALAFRDMSVGEQVMEED